MSQSRFISYYDYALGTVSEQTSTPLAVISVTYSPGEHLAPFVESLSRATQRPTRVVLADNGSTDGVPQAMAQQREDVTFLDTGGNIGYGAAMNAGARHLQQLREAGEVDQEFLLISNPDVVFQPASIDQLLDCARTWENAGAIGPRIVEPDGRNYPSARAVPTLSNGIGHALFSTVWPNNPWTKAYRDDDVMDRQRPAGWLSGSCLLLRWEAFDAVGGFDDRYFMYLEDVDLGDRLSRAGYSNIFCPEALITHAQGHSTKAVSGRMLRAHHESAYRFQADRHPRWWQAPIRLVLKVGLALRLRLAYLRDRRKTR